MKERLFAILAAAVLLITVLQPRLSAVPFSAAASAITPDADCHGGGQCST